MQYSEGTIGRVFILRLEDGDPMPSTVEDFAKEKNIMGGMAIFIGGVDDGGKIVVGPVDGKAEKIKPVIKELKGAHEVSGTGTLFPDADGNPILHMHAGMGRGDNPKIGCIRPGVKTWLVGEVILFEINGTGGKRLLDPSVGFALLNLETTDGHK
ncbi:MAG: PPC domain-containing DNA-binding protein [Verrucomicrobiota bacterium]|nr:PPC domain-containing DNA-binding protein [Verrucomicrobiota bacterium]